MEGLGLGRWIDGMVVAGCGMWWVCLARECAIVEVLCESVAGIGLSSGP